MWLWFEKKGAYKFVGSLPLHFAIGENMENSNEFSMYNFPPVTSVWFNSSTKVWNVLCIDLRPSQKFSLHSGQPKRTLFKRWINYTNEINTPLPRRRRRQCQHFHYPQQQFLVFVSPKWALCVCAFNIFDPYVC